jgi:hypothetical protein
MISFEEWKWLLREDCVIHGKVLQFSLLDDGRLQSLWQEGVLPSVRRLAERGVSLDGDIF